MLIREDYSVELFDFSGRNRTHQAHQYKGQAAIWHGPRGVVFLRLFVRCLVKSPCFLHWHMSAGGNLMRISPLLILLNRIVPSVYTIHSGSFPNQITAQNQVHRSLFRKLFLSAHCIVAVNSTIRDVLISELAVPDARIEVIPAYLSTSKYAPSSGSKAAERNSGTKILASGFATKIYWWEGLLEAVSDVPSVDELFLVFYSVYDEPYYSQILDAASRITTCRVKVFNDLDSETFLNLLDQCNMFVRPTLADGDSVAVREALGRGLLVVASDTVMRPDGCVLFRTGNAADLREKIVTHVTEPRKTHGPTGDFGQSLLSLYRRLLDSSSGIVQHG